MSDMIPWITFVSLLLLVMVADIVYRITRHVKKKRSK